jgi:hypothetical protein
MGWAEGKAERRGGGADNRWPEAGAKSDCRVDSGPTATPKFLPTETRPIYGISMNILRISILTLLSYREPYSVHRTGSVSSGTAPHSKSTYDRFVQRPFACALNSFQNQSNNITAASSR